MKKRILRYISIGLLAVAMLSTVAFAAVEASKYILRTTVGMATLSGGVIDINCTITATGIYHDVGVEWIDVYEDGEYVTSYEYDDKDFDYSYLMGHNVGHYTATVTHQGTPGKKYSATVSFFAGDEYSGGDVHSMGSAIVTAKK